MLINTKMIRKLIVALTALSLFGVVTGCADDPEEGNNIVTDAGADADAAEDAADAADAPDAPDAADAVDAPDAPEGDADAGAPGFTFATGNPVDNPDDFVQVDRVGMPAVSTVLVPSDRKTAYNEADPSMTTDFVGDFVATLGGLHDALDDDLTGLGLVPCAVSDPPAATDECVQQEIFAGGPTVASLVVPDTLTINPSADAGFPNGRLPSDQVINVTLAVIMLDMDGTAAVGGNDIEQNPFIFTSEGALGGFVNPTSNDKSFQDSFPFLAAPHTQ